jgi:hypothetical protein
MMYGSRYAVAAANPFQQVITAGGRKDAVKIVMYAGAYLHTVPGAANTNREISLDCDTPATV